MNVSTKQYLSNIILSFSCIILILTLTNLNYKLKYNLQAHHTQINYLLDKQSIQIKNVYCLLVESTSMEPTLFENNLVCFRESRSSSLNQGNIIHYLDNNNIDVVHRIKSISRIKKTITVQGDNNKYSEDINQSQVRGVLVLVLFS